MNYFRGLVLLGMFCFVCSSFVNGQNTKIDNVVGAIWEVTIYSAGKVPESTVWKFRATKNNLIFFGPDEIGGWKKSGTDKVTMEITVANRPKIRGTMELNKTRNNPPTYSGKLTRTNGDVVKVRMVMLED